MNINFLENQDDNQISLITQTISAFDEILKSTTTLLWDANQKIIWHSEASQKLKAKMEANKIASVTAATSMAINKAMSNLDHNNINDATKLRIDIIEKQLLQQTQTNKEILNHLKTWKHSQKNSHKETNIHLLFFDCNQRKKK